MGWITVYIIIFLIVLIVVIKLLKIRSDIAIFLQAFALIVGSIYHTSAIDRYKEQSTPEIDGNYKYFYHLPKTEYKFIVKNTANVDCANIWAIENIYLIVNGKVYESKDTPHFNYFVYNGSRDKIWNLKKGDEVELKINPLQITAFDLLKEKFNPIIITKWKFICSKENSSKKYLFEKYFIFDFNDRIYRESDSYVGGNSYIKKINDYIDFGPNKYIDIFAVTGDFEINPPKTFLVMKDSSILPLTPWTKLKIEDFNNSLLFYPGGLEIQPSDDIGSGSIFYNWNYANGKFSKGITLKNVPEFFYLKAWTMPPHYLSKEDKEKVTKKPEILKYFCYIELNITVNSDDTKKTREKLNQQKLQVKQSKEKARYEYIMDKAKEKYLRGFSGSDLESRMRSHFLKQGPYLLTRKKPSK